VRLVGEEPAKELVKRDQPTARRFCLVAAGGHDAQDSITRVGPVQPIDQ
jgi:hypothetical protein